MSVSSAPRFDVSASALHKLRHTLYLVGLGVLFLCNHENLAEWGEDYGSLVVEVVVAALESGDCIAE